MSALVRTWNKLPEFMQREEIRPYYNILRKKRFSLISKRFFDLLFSFLLLVLTSPLLILISLLIMIDSRGPIFFRQERITRYGKQFKIFKFRTMVDGADKMGALITSHDDKRITRIGRFMRKAKIDELPQLINVLVGDMSFVGTRPEVEKYFTSYAPEMYATALLPAGITSRASIKFRDEEKYFSQETFSDDKYIEEILPIKMEYNLKEIEEFSIWNDLKMISLTIAAILKKQQM